MGVGPVRSDMCRECVAGGCAGPRPTLGNLGRQRVTDADGSRGSVARGGWRGCRITPIDCARTHRPGAGRGDGRTHLRSRWCRHLHRPSRSGSGQHRGSAFDARSCARPTRSGDVGRVDRRGPCARGLSGKTCSPGDGLHLRHHRTSARYTNPLGYRACGDAPGLPRQTEGARAVPRRPTHCRGPVAAQRSPDRSAPPTSRAAGDHRGQVRRRGGAWPDRALSGHVIGHGPDPLSAPACSTRRYTRHQRHQQSEARGAYRLGMSTGRQARHDRLVRSGVHRVLWRK